MFICIRVRKMRKRILWCAFAFAVVLLIFMISTEHNIIQRIPFLDITTINDIRCYDEISTTEGIRDLDPESGKIIMNISITKIVTPTQLLYYCYHIF